MYISEIYIEAVLRKSLRIIKSNIGKKIKTIGDKRRSDTIYQSAIKKAKDRYSKMMQTATNKSEKDWIRRKLKNDVEVIKRGYW